MTAAVEDLATRLDRAGFIAAREEAVELLARSNGDDLALESMVQRRLRGEPLAWITGDTVFCDLKVNIEPGVYVPRWQSESLARRAVERLPPRGIAIDLCTGSGALAKVLMTQRPGARVVASELDDRAVACASSNGVEVYRGDLFEPIPRALEGLVDVVVGVVPYVPTGAMSYLSRDTLRFESPASYDGGPDGTDILRRVVADSVRFLRPGGALLLEIGGEEAEILRSALVNRGFEDVSVHRDDEGDDRGVEATLRRKP